MKYFLYALQILFIGLKLAGYINWSWWLVMLPLIYISILSFIVIIFISYKEAKMTPVQRSMYEILKKSSSK